MNKNTLFALICLLFVTTLATAQTAERPMIWVKPSDKTAILEKIKQHDWAKNYFDAFKNRVEADLKEHATDSKNYLAKMPLDWAKRQDKIPAFKVLMSNGGTSADERQAVIHYLQTGIDCGILYFLTDEERYAQLGADVLHTVIEGLVQLEPSEFSTSASILPIPC